MFGSSLQIEHELSLEVPNKVPFPFDTYLELQLDFVMKLNFTDGENFFYAKDIIDIKLRILMYFF